MNKLFVQVERVEDLTGRADNYFTPPETKERKPISNADRIRAMTDEELADYIDLHTADAMWCKSPPNDCPSHETCCLCILEWLKSPVEEKE